MKLKLQILKTIWINLLGISLSVYLFGIIGELSELNSLHINEVTQALAIGFIGGLYSVIGYGFMFWIGFIISISIIELILMNGNKKRIATVLIIECVVISFPFIYWLIEYSEWVFLIAVIAFLITQFIRLKRISKLLAKAI